MAEARVQLPLGALTTQRVGKLGNPRTTASRRCPRAHEIVGSNPTTLTQRHCGGSCAGTGRRLLTVVTQVRFLPPQLQQTEGQANWRWQPPRKRSSVTALRVRLPLLPPEVTRALGRAAEAPGFQLGQAGSTPAEHSCTRVGSSVAERVPVKH